MSTPHDYYDEHNHPHMEARGETAIYEDPDYIANEAGDQLPLVSSIGAGPAGEGILIDPVHSNDEQGTFDFGIKSDVTGEEIRHTPNLHAGHLHAVLDPEAADTEHEAKDENPNREIPETESRTAHFLNIYNKRNNVDKLLAQVELPQGAQGARIYISKREAPYELRTDYTIPLNTSDLLYLGTSLGVDEQHKAYDEQPYPRNWDVVIAYVKHPTEGYACISAGFVLQTNQTTTVVQFRGLFKCSEQEQVDFLELNNLRVTYIKHRERIEDNINKVQTITPSSTEEQYPSAKCVYEVEIDIRQALADEVARAKAAEQQLQSNIDAEEAARIAADNVLQDNIDAEETARKAADNALQDNIDAEASARAAADEEEATARQAADQTLQSNINDEATARQAADAAEASAREAGDQETLATAESYADTKISDHNTSQSAHQFIQGLITSLQTLFTNFKDTINSYIMSGTSATNQLTHKEFVNSSIASETANYIKNPTTNDVWDSLADLKAYTTTSTVGNNDYAVVQTQVTNKKKNADPQYKFDRYKFTKGSTPYADGWGREYTLHPGFTQAQWDALMSGATAAQIAKISVLENAVDALEIAVDNLDNTKVDKLSTSNSAYCIDANGDQSSIAYKSTYGSSAAGTLVLHDSDGNVQTGTPTSNNQASTKKYVDDGLSDKLDKSNALNKAYCTDSSGDQTMISVSENNTPGTIPIRDDDGGIIVDTPIINGHAATKKYVDDGLAEKQDTLTAGTEIDITDDTVSFDPTTAHSSALDSGITSTKVGNYDTHIAKPHVYPASGTSNLGLTSDPWAIVYEDSTYTTKNIGIVTTINEDESLIKTVKKAVKAKRTAKKNKKIAKKKGKK